MSGPGKELARRERPSDTRRINAEKTAGRLSCPAEKQILSVMIFDKQLQTRKPYLRYGTD